MWCGQTRQGKGNVKRTTATAVRQWDVPMALEMDNGAESFQCRDQRTLVRVFVFMPSCVQEGKFDGKILDIVGGHILIPCFHIDPPLEILGSFHIIGLWLDAVLFLKVPDL